MFFLRFLHGIGRHSPKISGSWVVFLHANNRCIATFVTDLHEQQVLAMLVFYKVFAEFVLDIARDLDLAECDFLVYFTRHLLLLAAVLIEIFRDLLDIYPLSVTMQVLS